MPGSSAAGLYTQTASLEGDLPLGDAVALLKRYLASEVSNLTKNKGGIYEDFKDREFPCTPLFF
jgi:hypothetical protein